MKPNFLVVGAAKAGTTWLHYCLDAHPEIFVPKAKELHFFSYPHIYQKGDGWYESFFDAASSQTVLGEVCPSYISFPNVPERIYKYNSDMKLIFVLRDPVQRAYSHYCMGMKQGKLSTDINNNLSDESNYVKLGLYYSQIIQFLEYFPLENIMIVTFDDIKNCPDSILEEVYGYLGISCDFFPDSSVLQPKNVSKSLSKFPAIYQFFKRQEKQIGLKSKFLRGLITEIRLKGKLEWLHKLNQGDRYPLLTVDKKRELAEFYASDVANLSKLVDRDLSFWLEPYFKRIHN